MRTFDVIRRQQQLFAVVFFLVWICSCIIAAEPERKTGLLANPVRDAHSDFARSGGTKPTSLTRPELQGIVRPKQEANLHATQPGVVTEVHVQDGQWVRAGDPLITFDNRVERADLALAKAVADAQGAVAAARVQVEIAKSLHERTRSARQSGASSATEVDAKRNQLRLAQAELQSELEKQQQAQAALQQAEAKLNQKTLHAPFDGLVVRVQARAGNTIQPDDLAVRMVDLATLQVELNLPIKLFKQLKTGKQYHLQAMAPVSRRIPAILTYSSPVIEPTSGTFRVLFELDNNQEQWPSGFEVWFDPN